MILRESKKGEFALWCFGRIKEGRAWVLNFYYFKELYKTKFLK
jgi:hypothetical protein